VGTSTAGVDNALRNTLVVEAMNLDTPSVSKFSKVEQNLNDPYME
jgi:hypothetical protein